MLNITRHASICFQGPKGEKGPEGDRGPDGITPESAPQGEPGESPSGEDGADGEPGWC